MSIQRWHAAHCYTPYNSTWSYPGYTTTNHTGVYNNIAVCKLCSQIPAQPVYLSCKDVFCSPCLQSYMHHGRYMDSLEIPCPHCKRLSAPPWGIWHLSHKVSIRCCYMSLLVAWEDVLLYIMYIIMFLGTGQVP